MASSGSSPAPRIHSTTALLLARRDGLVAAWSAALGDRLTTAGTVDRATIEREFQLLIGLLAQMVGPLRRESKALWANACDHYGRLAATRGLAAGEVVEELHQLRELLIMDLTPELRRGRPRRGMAALLRMNRVLDDGVAMAVAGYTDVLVATLFAHNGVPIPHSSDDPSQLDRQLAGLEADLQAVAAPQL